MIWTIKIEVIYGRFFENEWESTIEMDSESTLEDLHFVIQDAAGFDNDHLYDFFIARTERSRDKKMFDDDNGKIYSTTLERLFPLEKRKKLYYLFDYGDNWLFRISKTRKKAKEPVKDEKYPKLVTEKGKKPEQYPACEE
ncbi:hypothetical protein QUF70_02445 [Desulfobacterales bacterium HSG17]|nr:hypothetical protein [Desulfobacterales bacterium HSG17]